MAARQRRIDMLRLIVALPLLLAACSGSSAPRNTVAVRVDGFASVDANGVLEVCVESVQPCGGVRIEDPNEFGGQLDGAVTATGRFDGDGLALTQPMVLRDLTATESTPPAFCGEAEVLRNDTQAGQALHEVRHYENQHPGSLAAIWLRPGRDHQTFVALFVGDDVDQIRSDLAHVAHLCIGGGADFAEQDLLDAEVGAT